MPLKAKTQPTAGMVLDLLKNECSIGSDDKMEGEGLCYTREGEGNTNIDVGSSIEDCLRPWRTTCCVTVVQKIVSKVL